MATKSVQSIKILIASYGVASVGYFSYLTHSQVVDELNNKKDNKKDNKKENDFFVWNLTTKTLQDNWKDNFKRSLLFPYYVFGFDSMDWNKVSEMYVDSKKVTHNENTSEESDDQRS